MSKKQGIDDIVKNTLQSCGFSFVDYGDHFAVYEPVTKKWFEYDPRTERWFSDDLVATGKGVQGMMIYMRRRAEKEEIRNKMR